MITLWVTFVPCFLWIFAGAPFIDRLSTLPRLRGALSAITAAVVGVILNLAIWFALNVLFLNHSQFAYGPFKLTIPEWSSLDPRVLAIMALCALLLLRFHWNVVLVLTTAALCGILLSGF